MSIDLWAIDDANLDVYQFRLLCHIARVGICWKSIRTLAADCQMSVGKTSEVKNWLIENGFIIEMTDSKSGNTGYGVSSMFERSPHEQQRSPHEQQRSPHEPKTITIRQEHEETDPLDELVEYFLEESKCRRPKNGEYREKWLEPLVSIYKASDDNFNQTKRRIKESIVMLRNNGYTIANPGSIQNTAVSIQADEKPGVIKVGAR